MVGTNLRKHEIIGLLMIFLSGILIGVGFYATFWIALRPVIYGSIEHAIPGKDFLIFPMFFGLGFVMYVLGNIELKEAIPGKKRKR